MLKKLKDYLNENDNICFASIFGSYAKGKERKNSDLDLAIYFYKPPDGLDLLYLINTISNKINKEVDLVVLNNASAFLRHQVMKSGISLIIKDRIIHAKFREETMSDYEEYKYVSGINKKRLSDFKLFIKDIRNYLEKNGKRV